MSSESGPRPCSHGGPGTGTDTAPPEPLSPDTVMSLPRSLPSLSRVCSRSPALGKGRHSNPGSPWRPWRSRPRRMPGQSHLKGPGVQCAAPRNRWAKPTHAYSVHALSGQLVNTCTRDPAEMRWSVGSGGGALWVGRCGGRELRKNQPAEEETLQIFRGPVPALCFTLFCFERVRPSS